MRDKKNNKSKLMALYIIQIKMYLYLLKVQS